MSRCRLGWGLLESLRACYLSDLVSRVSDLVPGLAVGQLGSGCVGDVELIYPRGHGVCLRLIIFD